MNNKFNQIIFLKGMKKLYFTPCLSIPHVCVFGLFFLVDVGPGGGRQHEAHRRTPGRSVA